MRPILRLRPFKWFFNLNWYAIRCGEYPGGGEAYHLLDLGAITIGWSNKSIIKAKGGE